MKITFIIEGISEKAAGDIVEQFILDQRDLGIMVTDYHIEGDKE